MNPLLALVKERLEKEPLNFTEFMQLALYHPQFGYYSAGLQKFGREGDFITAPELSPLFGQALAQQCHSILKGLDSPIVLEFGAGSGRLCIDILQQLEVLNALPQKYYILELSASLRATQEQSIQAEIPNLFPRVEWLSAWPSSSFEGIILANEVLDAMPVARFLQKDHQIFESFVFCNEKGELEERFQASTNADLKAHLDKALPKDLDPYLSEANLYLDAWMAECANILDKGLILLIDYGFPRAEYYHPDRNQGTLICHHKHRSKTDFLAHLGEQDITAHVDFTHVAEAGVQAGLQLEGYTNQAAFLLANGILDLYQAIPEGKVRINAAQALKQLLQAEEMGELFKVIAFSKGLELPEKLQGFLLADRVFSL